MSSGSLIYNVRAPHVVHETVDGEVVAVDFTSGSYYSLRGAAGLAWGALDGGATVDDVVATLAKEYDVTSAASKVEAFLDLLSAEGLVVATPAPDANGAAPEAASGGTAPLGDLTFEKFTDMEEIILLDPVHDVSSSGWPHTAEADSESPA